MPSKAFCHFFKKLHLFVEHSKTTKWDFWFWVLKRGSQEKHNNNYYENKWTKQGQPWDVFYILECEHVNQARSIEVHIKKMKSKKYIDNLIQYPEMGQKLLDKYK